MFLSFLNSSNVVQNRCSSRLIHQQLQEH
jgi:hypothetical protein